MLKQKERPTTDVFAAVAGITAFLFSLGAHGADVKEADSAVHGAPARTMPACGHSTNEPPILERLPADGATVVRPDTPIKIYFDSDDPSYRMYQKKLQRGHFTVWINCQIQPATFDSENKVIVVDNNILERYTNYEVILLIKGKPRRGHHPIEGRHWCNHPMGKPGCAHHLPWKPRHGEVHFSFQTGSAIGEAIHLDARVEQSPVSVAETGEISIQVTDDYGLPATHATVKVTSDSETLTADTLLLEEGDDGKGIIALRDDIAESVDLTVTSQDTIYNDPVNTQTWNGTIEFITESGGDTDTPGTCPGDLPTDYQGEAIVVADTLNVRYGAGEDSPVAYTLSENETVTVRSVVDGEWAFIGYDDSRPVYTSICYLQQPTYDEEMVYINLGGDTGMGDIVDEYDNCHTGRIVDGEIFLHWECLGIIQSFYEPYASSLLSYEYASDGDGVFVISEQLVNGDYRSEKTVVGMIIDGDTYISWRDIDGLVPHVHADYTSFTYISIPFLDTLSARYPKGELLQVENEYYFRTLEEAEEAMIRMKTWGATYCGDTEGEDTQIDEIMDSYWFSLATLMIPVKLGGVVIPEGVAINAGLVARSFARNGVKSPDAYLDLAQTLIAVFNPGPSAAIATFREFTLALGSCPNHNWEMSLYNDEFYRLEGIFF